jgi:NAD(P)-dependent dehydrogenase (short-subunit alcohol dehydrogenase family)
LIPAGISAGFISPFATIAQMPVVLVTGNVRTGTSAALAELARRGHHVVDTDYGTADEQRRILRDLETFEPLLRQDATAEIDARAPLDEIVDALEQIAAGV